MTCVVVVVLKVRQWSVASGTLVATSVVDCAGNGAAHCNRPPPPLLWPPTTPKPPTLPAHLHTITLHNIQLTNITPIIAINAMHSQNGRTAWRPEWGFFFLWIRTCSWFTSNWMNAQTKDQNIIAVGTVDSKLLKIRATFRFRIRITFIHIFIYEN